ncbi:MAG: hypothetical protein ACE5JX_15690 [Acidobacteriota bacterium]
MAKRFSLIVLALSSPLMLLSFFWDHPITQWVFAILVMVYPVALMTLGAATRRSRLGPLKWVFASLGAVLVVSAAALLVYGRDSGRFWIGLPAPAAIMFYGLWLIPFVLVSAAYVWTFSTFSVAAEDLKRIRQLGHRHPPDGPR